MPFANGVDFGSCSLQVYDFAWVLGVGARESFGFGPIS